MNIEIIQWITRDSHQWWSNSDELWNISKEQWLIPMNNDVNRKNHDHLERVMKDSNE